MKSWLSARQSLAVGFSLLLSIMLMIVPVPRALQWVWPEWISLVLIFWMIALPRVVGITICATVGLIMDILGGVLLGQYAFAMSVVALLTNLLRHRLKLFPFWQQASGILVVVGFAQLSILITRWLIGFPPQTILFWLSTLSSVIIWPGVYLTLKAYQRRLF